MMGEVQYCKNVQLRRQFGLIRDNEKMYIRKFLFITPKNTMFSMKYKCTPVQFGKIGKAISLN